LNRSSERIPRSLSEIPPCRAAGIFNEISKPWPTFIFFDGPEERSEESKKTLPVHGESLTLLICGV